MNNKIPNFRIHWDLVRYNEFDLDEKIIDSVDTRIILSNNIMLIIFDHQQLLSDLSTCTISVSYKSQRTPVWGISLPFLKDCFVLQYKNDFLESVVVNNQKYTASDFFDLGDDSYMILAVENAVRNHVRHHIMHESL